MLVLSRFSDSAFSVISQYLPWRVEDVQEVWSLIGSFVGVNV